MGSYFIDKITVPEIDAWVHYSRSVTVEEVPQALIAVMQLVPAGPA